MCVEIIITEKEQIVLQNLANSLKNISPTKHVDLFLSLAKNASRGLPKRIQTILLEFKQKNKSSLLIENLPVTDCPSTPENNKYHVGETTTLGILQAIFNQFLGEMVSYEAEGDGHLFQDMVPNRLLQTTQTSLGSKIELELHTEQAFSEIRPDYLSLACLNGDENAKTFILHLQDIIDHLSTEDVELLKKEKWKIGVDMSFIMNGCKGDLRGPLSILNNNNGNWELIFDQDLMVGETTNASELIEKITNIYYDYREHVILKKGDLLILNNHKLVHGRSSFEPKFDGNDRFIIRSFILKNLKKIYGKTGNHNRMVAKEYS